ncbi:MAG: AAA family ATPase, partial [Polyangiaceae bacterium]|nr:AAA family ATPase [Polyangiaceae bacterium]
MYLRKLRVRNIKLLRDVEIDFTRPRMWTTVIGENGLCKTTLLQAIALAASGPDRANQLANVPFLHDARRRDERAEIEAEFGFGERMHATREYPGLSSKPEQAPRLESRLWLEPGWKVFQGSSRYLDTPPTSPEHDPLREARAKDLPGWFVGGYGTTRALPKGLPGGRPDEFVVGRLDTLFDRGSLLATNFSRLAPRKLALIFESIVSLLFSSELLPD